MNTIENINNIVTEDTVEAVIDAVEVIPVKSINWRKLGKVGAAVGAVAGIGAGIVAGVKYIQKKKQEKTKQNEAAESDIDNVKVAERDFVEKEPAEK